MAGGVACGPTGLFFDSLAKLMHRVGAIKNKPAYWQDYFFKDAKPLQGS